MMIRFNHEPKDKLKTLMKGITKGYGTSEFNRVLTKSVGRGVVAGSSAGHAVLAIFRTVFRDISAW
jgi:hypothetical protein